MKPHLHPTKIAPCPGGSGPASNTWFFGPRVPTSNGTSIGSAVFAWLTVVTNRQTHGATKRVTIGRVLYHAWRCGLIMVRPTRDLFLVSVPFSFVTIQFPFLNLLTTKFRTLATKLLIVFSPCGYIHPAGVSAISLILF